MIEKEDCVNCFISVDNSYKGCARCDKCGIAIEKEKEENEMVRC